MDSTPGLRNTGSCGRAVAGLRMVWNAIIVPPPPVPGGSAQAAHRHCTRPYPGESGLVTRDYLQRIAVWERYRSRSFGTKLLGIGVRVNRD